MRWTTPTLAATAAAALLLGSLTAEAAPRRAGIAARGAAPIVAQGAGSPRRVVRTRTARAPARITVRRERSFLDPGTEVLPGTRTDTTYAFPPLSYPSSVVDIGNMRRYPLPGSTSGEIYPFWP